MGIKVFRKSLIFRAIRFLLRIVILPLLVWVQVDIAVTKQHVLHSFNSSGYRCGRTAHWNLVNTLGATLPTEFRVGMQLMTTSNANLLARAVVRRRSGHATARPSSRSPTPSDRGIWCVEGLLEQAAPVLQAIKHLDVFFGSR